MVPILYLNFYISQSDFYAILGLFSLAFVGYIGLILASRGGNYFGLLILMGFIVRVILCFSMPTLSDDIYRFLWDGHLIHNSIHPLSYLPSELIANADSIDAYMQVLYPNLNSQEYFTIYPPLSQLVFYIATISENWSVATSSIMIKLHIILAELMAIYAGIKLLQIFNLRKERILLYLLNPLIIVELCGNLHFEGIMVAFLMVSLYALLKHRYLFSGILMALSVGTKLLPVMFVPAILIYLYNSIDRKDTLMRSFFRVE